MALKKTRYKCRGCGNSAMFEYEGSAKVAQVTTWVDRETGYVALGDPMVVWSRLEKRPVRCWVCKSTDIGYAQMAEGEVGVNDGDERESDD